jgi:K+-transporting ATPase ATPase C chain
MLNHIRANLLLLAATLLLCSVIYPLILWVVGQTFFHDKAEGNIFEAKVTDENGKERTVSGSLQIAQPFSDNKYFQPRPSAVNYDASASGASNYAASNPLLRARVARQLGPMVKYAKDSPTKPGEPVGPDIEAWFAKQPEDYALTWAKDHPSLAEQWVKDNAAIVAVLLEKEEKDVKNNASANAVPFFEAYMKVPEYKGTWPTTAEKKDGDTTTKVVEPVKKGEAIQAYFFDLWLTANKDNKEIVLEKVPADMVMASGSGLDPHITMANARYQLGRVADEWATKTGAPRDKVVAEIEKLLDDKKFAPMFGLFGEPMVNVLEVNLELPKRMEPLAKH